MAHQHKFVIPVEWLQYPAGFKYLHAIGEFTVIKLRCVCGEEVERNG